MHNTETVVETDRNDRSIGSGMQYKKYMGVVKGKNG
jgi:hypothetical protein